MAGDTRESSTPAHQDPTPGETEPPTSTKASPKNYETFQSPPASANALPAGSGQNTAGSKLNPSLTDGLKTVRWQDFSQLHMYPCVRESLLTGIGAGFGIGSLRGIFGSTIPKAANWAVGSFMLFSLANYEYCMYKRQLEKTFIKRAVDIMDKKKGEKEESARIKREERRRLKEEADRKEEEDRKKKSWKFW